MTMVTAPRGGLEAETDRPIQAVEFALAIKGTHFDAMCKQCDTTWNGDTRFDDVGQYLAYHSRRCVNGIPLDASA